jgi:hypothetical protein
MLYGTVNIESLNPIRKFDSTAKVVEALDNSPNVFKPDLGFLLRYFAAKIWNAVFPSTKTLIFRVSAKSINAGKALAKQQKGQNGVDFVSTDDVLTSCLANCIKSNTTIMAINFQGRIEGPTDNDVGNYDACAPYFSEADYGTPELIRKSLSRRDGLIIRASEPRTKPLTFFQHMKAASCGIINNWASFDRSPNIPGATQELHVPIVSNTSVTGCILTNCIIFRPDADSLAVCVTGRQAVLDRIKASGMFYECLDMLI